MALCRDEVLVKRTRSNRAVPTRDRFSTLPVEIKLNILERNPFEEAARTNILSRTSSWSELSQVILDKSLFEERKRWIEPHPSDWVNKVTEILTNRCEGLIPIQKFVLHIPDMQYKWGLYINSWLFCLSRNNIQELSVDNWNITTYKLSSILFKCSKLTRLMLRNCAFYESLVSFQNVQFLHLKKIAFDSEIVGDVTLRVPSLVRLELVDCRGFRYLSICAPKPKNIVIAGNGMSGDGVKLISLMFRQKLGYKVRDIPVPRSDRIEFVFGPRSQRAGR